MNKADQKGLGGRLKAVRERLGLKQAEFAAATDILRPHYTNVENGKANIGLDALLTLCREHGVSMDWLLGLDQDPAKDGSVADLVFAYREMPAEQREALLKLVQPWLGNRGKRKRKIEEPPLPFVEGEVVQAEATTKSTPNPPAPVPAGEDQGGKVVPLAPRRAG